MNRIIGKVEIPVMGIPEPPRSAISGKPTVINLDMSLVDDIILNFE